MFIQMKAPHPTATIVFRNYHKMCLQHVVVNNFDKFNLQYNKILHSYIFS